MNINFIQKKGAKNILIVGGGQSALEIIIDLFIQGIIALIYLVVGCSIGAGWFWNKGLEKSEASKNGLFLALEPLFGILLAVLVLGEKLNFLSITGIILVILSAAICMIFPKQES